MGDFGQIVKWQRRTNVTFAFATYDSTASAMRALEMTYLMTSSLLPSPDNFMVPSERRMFIRPVKGHAE